MKSKLGIIIIISIIATAILFYIFAMKCNRKLPELPNYRIVSNTGQSIPAKLYSRTVNAKIGNSEQAINEFILCFNDSLVSSKLNISGDEKVYKYLVIVPDLKMIGLVNKMKSLEEKDGYICQSDDEADNFTSIINNRTFFSNPPITDANFADGKITFNAYGVLKQFGDSIVIETVTTSN